MIHLHATRMHNKMGAVKLLEDLLSQIHRLGNHNPFPEWKTIISAKDPTLVIYTLLYSVPNGQYRCVLPLGLEYPAQ